MNDSRNQFAATMFFGSLVVSIPIYLYYSHIHIHGMDPYPHKLEGYSVHVASLLVASPIVYFAILLEQSWFYLGDTLQPSIKKIALATIVFILTPLGNFVWIPIPILAPITMGILSGPSDLNLFSRMLELLPLFLILLIFTFPAYLVACLALSQSASFGMLLWRILTYLFGCFIAATLISGVSYI